MTKSLYRNELDLFNAYVPGKPIEEVQREFGLERIEKLASNENPLGPSPKALEEIKKELENINTYPEASSKAVREAIAEQLGVNGEQIVVGNGGEHIIQIIAQTFVNTGDEAIMADTTFELYGSTVALMGGKNIKIPLKNYKHDIEAFAQAINSKTRLVYVCTPNNPTGNIMSKDELNQLVKSLPDDVVLVLDEAYYNYARVNPDYPESIPLIKERPNTVIIRTFSKVAGIAAVRVGFAITSEEIARQMSKVKGTFFVNKLAQAAALGALKDQEHMEKTVKLNYDAMKIMEEYFQSKGLEYIPSNANFVFVDTKLPSQEVFQKLMKKGVIIRPGYAWGWDTWLRVSTGTLEQTRFFTEKLDEILRGE